MANSKSVKTSLQKSGPSSSVPNLGSSRKSKVGKGTRKDEKRAKRNKAKDSELLAKLDLKVEDVFGAVVKPDKKVLEARAKAQNAEIAQDRKRTNDALLEQLEVIEQFEL